MDIEVDSGGVRGVLGSFQGEVASLQAQFEEIISQTEAVKSSWQGDEADAILGQIEQLQTAFEAINEKNKGYIAFMESSAAAYDTEDSSISASADSLTN